MNNQFKNKLHTLKKGKKKVSGKLYGMKIKLLCKNKPISSEVGLLDSGSGYSLMGIDKYWEINRKCKLNLEESDLKLVSVTYDDIEVLGAAKLTVQIMGIQREVAFTVVSDAVSFAGSLLLGTNLFQEFPLLFDFKNGNVLVTEGEIYDHTVIPLETMKGDSNGLISRMSSGNKVPKEEEKDMSEDEELLTDDSDT